MRDRGKDKEGEWYVKGEEKRGQQREKERKRKRQRGKKGKNSARVVQRAEMNKTILVFMYTSGPPAVTLTWNGNKITQLHTRPRPHPRPVPALLILVLTPWTPLFYPLSLFFSLSLTLSRHSGYGIPWRGKRGKKKEEEGRRREDWLAGWPTRYKSIQRSGKNSACRYSFCWPEPLSAPSSALFLFPSTRFFYLFFSRLLPPPPIPSRA